ncbi:MAG: transcription termination factor NusA [Patescibacteria group bacterium]|nr:transcription termination factor NusA [Patescibacteria group bacterium]
MLTIKQLQSFISQISEARGLPEEEVESALLDALSIAYKKDNQLKDAIVRAKKERGGEIKFYLVKKVIADDEEKVNPQREIRFSEVQNIDSNLNVGDEVYFPLPPQDNFSRIAAQTAKQLIIQKLREAEKTSTYHELKEKENKVISGVIERRDANGNVYVNLGKVLGVMFKSETIPGEIYRPGQRMRFYVYAVESTPRGVNVFLSRAHPLLVPAIFSVEVPEIIEGVIEIKGIARDPGVRSKMAVYSNLKGIDAIGACIGVKGARVISIMNELNNEKIDIIPWEEDPLKFVANALLPAKVLEVRPLPRRTMLALVPEDEIPLAIGKNGHNIKLAAKLTGWQIEVRSAANPEIEIEGGLAKLDEQGEEDEFRSRAENS